MTEGRDLWQVSEDTIKLMSLIRAYRHRGHLVADLDPLNLNEDVDINDEVPPFNIRKELEPAYYHFSEADLDREFVVTGELPGPAVRKLRDIVHVMKKAYCGKIGAEYRHMLNKEEKVWIATFLEAPFQIPFTNEEKLKMLQDLARSELFEKFLSLKHSTAKRFGLEGGEAVIPGLQALLEDASEFGVDNIIIGMPHRGRLNVLGNIVGKSLEQIFHEFTPFEDPDSDSYLGSGDVKYHLGTSSYRTMSNGKEMHFSLLANPSHLEAVDPVAVGKTRAKQFFTGDVDRKKTMCVLLHGDASFAGQGVVAETLELSDLRDYTTGGTVHIVVNNQIGFTTDPRYARSSPYPTDVAKTVGVPIFHVNGDDLESTVRVFRLAVAYRQRFGKDVVIDVFCYRRHGHNELDQPMFTQPLMYKKIKEHPTVLTIYAKQLVKEGVMSEDEVDALKSATMKHFQEKFEASKHWVPRARDWLSSQWKGIKPPQQYSEPRPTGVSVAQLAKLGDAINTIPEHFKPHPLLRKIVQERKTAIDAGEGIDWATGEMLAMASLLAQGVAVRLSGQDSERGTFSQRHAVWHDQTEIATHVPLNNLGVDQAQVQICNSNLSEMGVLGFETGFSLESPHVLVMWEAQFGDFVNGAQVILDTFLSAGEMKWRRQSALTMLLPHGYEGQGPEHSSARLERFLQMCSDDPDTVPDMNPQTTRQIQECNWQVAYPSTPANYFHLLRRQLCRDFRKPLVVMTPKSLLRHPLCKSRLSEMDEGKYFLKALDDPSKDLVPDEDIRKLVFCSGKVFYDLYTERGRRKVNDLAIIRLEQISPFPFDLVAGYAKKYPAAQVIWCQEESKNMGAWTYVQPRFLTSFRHYLENPESRPVTYVGREPSAAPATGMISLHNEEERELMRTIFE
mmetsp:Transcript_11184/g.22273  ORF Transcript_11184/g.22273 Transcript_11184/m.22273 type:complete len:901 (+) Transcript_11184:691-3393(+)